MNEAVVDELQTEAFHGCPVVLDCRIGTCALRGWRKGLDLSSIDWHHSPRPARKAGRVQDVSFAKLTLRAIRRQAPKVHSGRRMTSAPCQICADDCIILIRREVRRQSLDSEPR